MSVSPVPTLSEAQTYRITDANVPYTATTLQYRLKQIDLDGSAVYGGEVEIALDTPQALVLHGNFPNPVGSSTTIRYELPTATDVRLTVYDILGRTVRVLTNERQPAGRKEVHLNAIRLPSGFYFYRLRADDCVKTRRMTVIQ